MGVHRAAGIAIIGAATALAAVAATAAAQGSTPAHGLTVLSAPAMDQSFDGVETFILRDENGTSQTLTQYVKGNKFRVDMADPKDPANSADIIIDGTTQTTTFLLPAQKQYLQFTPQDVSNAAATVKPIADSLAKASKFTAPTPVMPQTVQAPPPNPVTWTVTQTGTDQVAGVTCNVYHISGTDAQGNAGSGDVCSAPSAGFVMYNAMAAGAMNPAMTHSADPQTQAYYSAMRQVTAGNSGVVKLTMTSKGKTLVPLEATNISRTAPPDAAFEVPAGYTKFSLAAMLKGGSGAKTGSGPTSAGQAVGDAAKSGAQGAIDQSAHDAGAAAAKAAVKKAFHFP